MAKEKDPAFLFYPKDWLEGTAEMSKEEKGVFIDLLCHHHQKKNLPSDEKILARLAGLSLDEFMLVWATLQHKFLPIGDRLYNRKLTVVMTERSQKGHRNTIIGTLAAVIKKHPAGANEKKLARSDFNVDDFIDIPTEDLTERLTEWLDKRLKNLLRLNLNTSSVLIEGGMGETPHGALPPPPDQTPEPFVFNFDTSLPDYTLEACERNQHATTGKKNTGWVQAQWDIFLLERVNDPPLTRAQYKTLPDLTKYFLNWMRNKFPKNGSDKKSSGDPGGQLTGVNATKETLLQLRKSVLSGAGKSPHTNRATG